MPLNTIIAAIKSRAILQFEYNKPGKAPGVRIGHPHAVYIFKAKNGRESTKVDIVQSDGVSDSGQEFPSFRMFEIGELTSVRIDKNLGAFEISPDYNPESPRYQFAIAKV